MLQSERKLKSIWRLAGRNRIGLSIGVLLGFSCASAGVGQMLVKDPGVRNGSVDSGQPLASIGTSGASDYFLDGLSRFQEVESVSGAAHNGLGPRFNSNSCSSCHAQPAIGGSSPRLSVFPFVGGNPETQVTTLNPAQKHAATIHYHRWSGARSPLQIFPES